MPDDILGIFDKEQYHDNDHDVWYSWSFPYSLWFSLNHRKSTQINRRTKIYIGPERLNKYNTDQREWNVNERIKELTCSDIVAIYQRKHPISSITAEKDRENKGQHED